ncbi:MAG: arylesterase [Immundisolibacterales bacterium]|nr:arylesterase [Immundisolibacterales bacterium]
MRLPRGAWGRARAALGLAAAAVILAFGTRLAAADGPLRILMLGDSLTAGYGLASHEALPARVEAALRALGLDARVINAGVSGDTTSGGLARIDWALADDPHAVVVALGANDGLRAIDPAVTRSNLDRLLAVLSGRRLPVLLAGMLAPPNLGPDYGARFDPVYPDLAARHGALLYPFLLEGVATVTALNQADGLHPNAAGVEVIAERMLPAVLCLVSRADRSAPATLPDGAGSDCERWEPAP